MVTHTAQLDPGSAPPTGEAPPTLETPSPSSDEALSSTVAPLTHEAPPSTRHESPPSTRHESPPSTVAPPTHKAPPSTIATPSTIVNPSHEASKSGHAGGRGHLRSAEDLAKEVKEHPGQYAAPGEWVRPLGSMECFMGAGGWYGSMNTVQVIWLSSSQPIRVEDVRQAIVLVVERTGMLQLCVVWRWLRPWFRRMDRVEVDFDVAEGDVMETYYKQLQTAYHMAKGPLWRARLVPLPQGSCGGGLGGQDEGPYHAALVVSIHHVITDGVSNMVFCRDILTALNARLTGTMCHVPKRPVIPALSDSLLGVPDWWYAGKYYFHKAHNVLLRGYNSRLYFNGLLTPPKPPQPVTTLLYDHLTPEQTTKLVQCCRDVGVSVHSAVTAVGHLALFRVAQQRSNGRLDEAWVNVSHCVNMRRYFPAALKEIQGCHFALQEREVLLNTRDGASRENLWALARRVHKALHTSLNVDYHPARIASTYEHFSPLIHINHAMTKLGCRNVSDCHFITTNMGNLKDLLPGTYQGPVSATGLLRGANSDYSGHPYTLCFHTFRGHLMLSLDHFHTKMNLHDGQEFFTNVMQDLRALVSIDTLNRQLA